MSANFFAEEADRPLFIHPTRKTTVLSKLYERLFNFMFKKEIEGTNRINVKLVRVEPEGQPATFKLVELTA